MRHVVRLSNTLLGVLIVLVAVAFAFVVGIAVGVVAVPVLIICCAYAGFYVVGEDIVEFIRSNWPGEEEA